jgi:uncharacterized protein YciU (UPF0263 family)
MTKTDEHGVPEFEIKSTLAAESDSDDYKHAEVFAFADNIDLKHRFEAECFVVNKKWPDNIPYHVAIKWINDYTLGLYWSNDDEERLITSKWSYNGDDQKIPNVIWQMYEPGELCTYEASAPGYGHTTFKVTRKDDTGLYGICIEDTVWVPE